MNQTLLLSSIAPPISKATNSLDVEKYNWTLLCIKSWKDSGHDILSINTQDEFSILSSIYPDLDYKIAARSTKTFNNRPLIYISDALNFAKLYPHKRFSICNSDVLVTESIKLFEDEKYNHSTFYSNRLNIESQSSTSGELFSGIDYLNMSKELVFLHEETLFAYGMPWWDYWYPYYSQLMKFNLIRVVNSIENPILLHKIHADAWNPKDLCIMGKHFIDLMHNQGIVNIRSNTLDKLFADYNNMDVHATAQVYALIARNICGYIHDKSNLLKI
jgi:hypothetical protein